MYYVKHIETWWWENAVSLAILFLQGFARVGLKLEKELMWFVFCGFRTRTDVNIPENQLIPTKPIKSWVGLGRFSFPFAPKDRIVQKSFNF